MSSQEIYVVIILGLVGYWGTAAVIRHFSEQKTQNCSPEENQTFNTDAREVNSESIHSHDDENSSCFQILGVSDDASLEEIKLAYKKMMSLYHPDKVNGLAPEFNEIALKKSKEINSAYDEAIRLSK